MLQIRLFAGLLATLLSGARGVDHYYGGEACPAADPFEPLFCDTMSTTFQGDGIYHLLDAGGTEHEAYCDMTGGRWTVLLRRGVDGDAAAVAAADQLDFVDSVGDGSTFGTLYGTRQREFFEGTQFLEGIGGTFDLLVDLETDDGQQYFAVFADATYSAAGLQVGAYTFGTAGNGTLPQVFAAPAPFDASCSPAWFGADCAQIDTPGRPHLTRALDGQIGVHWPGLPAAVSKIQLKARRANPAAEYCTRAVDADNQPMMAFTPELLSRATVQLHPGLNANGRAGMPTTVSITCNDPTQEMPLMSNKISGDYTNLGSTMTFTCSQSGNLADTVLAEEFTCVDACPPDYTRVTPTVWTRDDGAGGTITDEVFRFTCVSPVLSPPGIGPFEAARRCGERGEQLIDFPVPATETFPGANVVLTAMYHRAFPNPGNTVAPIKLYAMDLRGRQLITIWMSNSWFLIGKGDTTARCITIEYSATHQHGTKIIANDCFTSSAHFACHTSPQCAPGQYFHEGFCFEYAPEVPLDQHGDACYKRASEQDAISGMPAVNEAAVTGAAAAWFTENRPTSAAGFATGVYKRGSQFFWGAEPLAAVAIGTDLAADGECVVYDAASDQLQAADCASTDPYPVLCQYPGLPPDECPTLASDLGVETSSSAGPNALQSSVVRTCDDGQNFWEAGGPHDVTYTCSGLRRDWELTSPLTGVVDVAAADPYNPTCVIACDPAVDLPANANYTVGSVHRYISCHERLMMADGRAQSSQLCDHTTGQFSPSPPPDCDRCIEDPFIPDDSFTADLLWNNTPMALGQSVTYECRPGLVVPGQAGQTLQTQTCTTDGWVGDVSQCAECQWLAAFDDPDLFMNVTSPAGFGQLVELWCPPHRESSDGLQRSSAVCTPDGWSRCHEPFVCDRCFGEPPDTTGLASMSRNWTLGDKTIGAVANYSCLGGLTAASGETHQLLTCTMEVGWQGDILPCDTCAAPPAGDHESIAGVDESRLGGGALGSSVDYLCHAGLATGDGQTHIRAVCQPDGWSVCEAQIQCTLCSPLPPLLTWGGTLTWNYTGVENDLGTAVTITCEDRLATPSLATEQTVVCGVGGWNVSEVQACDVCLDPPPSPAPSMVANATWSLGDLTATYTCLDHKLLPWQRSTYELTCSPSGWSCVPDCSWCAPPPAPPAGSYNENYFGNPGGTAVYSCVANRATANQTTSQELVCGETEWTGQLLPCDSCLGYPSEALQGQQRLWSGNNTLQEVVHFDCNDGMVTAGGLYQQNQTCLDDGWTQPPEPCSLCVQPPALTRGMSWDWAGNRTINTSVTYTCDGNMTTMSGRAQQTIECTEYGWSPYLESCAECRMDIPWPGNGTEARNVSWDGGRYPGSRVYYTCQNGLSQTATCINGAWRPGQLPECILPTVLPPGEITFAPLPPFDDRYPATTDYYWGTIDANMTENAAAGAFTTGNGPLGFDTSIQLDGTGCMTQLDWPLEGDACARNPADCADGFSFSLWMQMQLDDTGSMFQEASDTTAADSLQYLLSTGGDDSGHPGVAIYLQDHNLHALVSTGAEYWLSSVTGLLKNNTWNNIGVRWSRAPFEHTGQPGLQLVINNVTEGYTIMPSPAKATAKAGLSPVEVMVGCHRTASNLAYRHKAVGEFDEVAMWTRPLPENETLFFIGGYDSQDEGLDMEKLQQMFQKCSQCREDPVQFKAFISKTLVAAKTAPEPSPTVQSTAAGADAADAEVELPADVEQAPPEQVEKIKGLAKLMYDLTDSCKTPMGQDELKDFLEMGALLDESMELKTLNQWRTVEYASKEDGGASTVVTRLEKWALDCSSHVPMEPKDKVLVDKKMKNLEMQVEKMKTFNFRQDAVLTYPRGEEERGLNTISFATELFDKGPECTFVDMNLLFSNYRTYGKIVPRRASLLALASDDEDRVAVDGNVMSLQVRLNDELEDPDPSLVANCTPSQADLRAYPVWLSIAHTTPRKALRQALFHEDEINTGILRRVCVWWNPELSDYGSWDADGCKALESTEFYTKCACAHFGQFTVMIEKVPPKVIDIEYQWLQIVKYVCYCLSALLLLIFIVAVIAIRQLHEMFHLMRLQTAIGLLVGSAFMVMSDIPEVRADRHACVAFAAVIHAFYLLAGCMVAMEGMADFSSVTSGAIGGKLRAYTAIACGVPLLSLGYAMLLHLHEYGTDPRCMLGWPDAVKMTMFVPLMVCMCLAAVFAALVSCNMAASRLRKENIVAEQLTVCKGYVFFALFFVVTWIVGVLAYLKLGLSVPGFYPLFQVLNSTTGIVFFLFCGVGSERFRLLLTGKAQLRRKMLMSYTVTEQLVPQEKAHEQLQRPDTPDEQLPYDPDARGPRRALVA